MQIKTIMRYHVTLFRMAIIKKPANDKCARGYGEKGNFLHCWWEYKLVQPLWRTICRFLKLKIELPYDPAIPLLGIYLEKTKTLIQKDTCNSCSQQHYLQQPRYGNNPSVNQHRMDKEDVVHIYNGILLSHKKEQNNAICSDMDGPRDYQIK